MENVFHEPGSILNSLIIISRGPIEGLKKVTEPSYGPEGSVLEHTLFSLESVLARVAIIIFVGGGT
jgi:hypothetical protein